MSAYPILLVPGLYDTSAIFKRMRADLLRGGFAPVRAMNIVPSNASISIEAMGQQVLEEAQALCNSEGGASNPGGARIDVVGFSMGALAARYFIQRLGGRDMVRRFISISGPQHGTLTAYLLGKIGIRQMRPNSDLLQDLDAEADPWGEVEVYSFWTPMDLMIIPASSSVLKRAHSHAFNVLLHPWMVTDHTVIAAVIKALSATA